MPESNLMARIWMYRNWPSFLAKFLTTENLELSVRVIILLFIDFILNGSIEALILSYFRIPGNLPNAQVSNFSANLTAQFFRPKDDFRPTFFEILALYDRKKIHDLRFKLNLSLLEMVQMDLLSIFGVFSCILMLFLNLNHVISVVNWPGPLILLYLSTVLHDEISWAGLNFDWTLKKIAFTVCFVAFLAIFGHFSSNFYVKSRFNEQIFPNFWPPVCLKIVFYAPFLKFCGFDRIFGYEKFILTNYKYFYLTNIMAEILCLYANLPFVARNLARAANHVTRTVRDFGLQMFLAQEWTRLRIPRLFRCLFSVRMIFHAILYCSALLLSNKNAILDHVTSTNNSTSPTNHSAAVGGVFKYLTIRSCETMTSVLGTTGFVSGLGGFFGSFFDWLLGGSEGGGAGALLANRQEAEADEPEQNPAVLTGILFIILCIQTNITGLPGDKRVAKLYRNLWLLLMALLHYVHNAVSHVLSRLTAIGDFRLKRHIRPLLVALLVILAPFSFLILIWPTFGQNMFNPWILSVAIFALELLIKMSISLTVYFITIVDVKFLKFNPKTETLIDRVQIFGSCLEYIFGIILFVDGLWIFFFDQGGFLRLIMIGFHGYCNIYQQGLDGWRAFKRRAVCQARLNSLKDATDQQIREHNDLCVICFQEMSSGTAKITKCGHFFHVTCIKKLLYHRDTCPMCHRSLY